jgi:hypothetical protein
MIISDNQANSRALAHRFDYSMIHALLKALLARF